MNKKYFDGKNLYGDDFSPKEIELWFQQEQEGYFNLISKSVNLNESTCYNPAEYVYHTLNINNGYSKIPNDKFFMKALGIGSSFGDEFVPIASKIKELFILEPSKNMKSNVIAGKLRPTYVIPNISGSIDFPSDNFDLVTCFGTLHHIANVKYVLSELIRVTAPGGYLLIREPIRSMGDWTLPRNGLTQNERGIPLGYFRN